MNGEVAQWLGVLDALGTLGAFVLIAYAFYSGNLISRKVHDDIVDVYQKEAEKLTKAINGSMGDLAKAQTDAIEESKTQHASYLADSQISRQRVREGSAEMMVIMNSTLEYIKTHDENTQKLVGDAIVETVRALK